MLKGYTIKPGRKAPRIAVEELRQHIQQTVERFVDELEGDFRYDFNQLLFSEQFRESKLFEDIRKVSFDFENTTVDAEEYFGASGDLVGFHEINGLAFLGIQAGGDWEYPVFFIIYWDGKQLRGYVPTNGNVFNPDTKMAFGNDEENDGAPDDEILRRMGFQCTARDFNGNYDWDLIQSDILTRIQVV